MNHYRQYVLFAVSTCVDGHNGVDRRRWTMPVQADTPEVIMTEEELNGMRVEAEASVAMEMGFPAANITSWIVAHTTVSVGLPTQEDPTER